MQATPGSLPHRLGWILLTAIVYFVLARAGLLLAFQTSNATPVWPPSGWAFAAVLLWGRAVASGIWLGAWAANLSAFLAVDATTPATALWTSGLIGLGNTAEALAGYYLLGRLLPGVAPRQYFQRVPYVFRFLMVALIMCLASCTVGAAAGYAAGTVAAAQLFTVWFTWWTGDVTGILLLTPLLLAWWQRPEHRATGGPLEGLALFTGLVLVSIIVFESWFVPPFLFTRAYWVIPFLVWAAVRFGTRVVTVAVIVSAVLAVLGTANGKGPFVTTALNDGLLAAQGFVALNSVMLLLLNAALLEREQTAASLREARAELEHLVARRTAALTASNGQLAEAQRLAHMGSWEWEVARNQIAWSDELYRIYGLKAGSFEPTYENYLACIHPEDRARVHDAVQRSYASGAPFEFHHRILRPDGAVRILHGRGKVERNAAGDVVRMVGTAQDVTEQKRAGDLLLHTSQELEQKNRELERSNAELASFSYAASHDLQAPLRKIQVFSERILDNDHDRLSDTGRDYFGRIQGAVTHMKSLIEDLLSYSRVSTTEKLFEYTDLNLVLLEVKADLAEAILQKGAVIDSCALPRLPVIPYQVRQLFTNIIGNALKFCKPGVPPQILIEADTVTEEGAGDHATQTYHHLSISDNGIGFNPGHAAAIFKIFERLHSRAEYEGTGIGLAICQKIVENHNGRISATGEEGKGATFHIYLPAQAVEQPKVEAGDEELGIRD